MIQHIHIGMSKPSFGTHMLPVFFNTTRHLYRARYVNLNSYHTVFGSLSSDRAFYRGRDAGCARDVGFRP